MYPTAAFGFLLVAAAVVLVFRPERRYVGLAAALAVATATSAVLGTATGIINTLRYAAKAPAEEQAQVVQIGCAESLNVVVLGGILITLASIGAIIAGVRAARRPATPTRA